MRIALGKLGHEANTFSPLPTVWDDFARKSVRRGPEILRGLEGLNTEDAGAVGVLRAEPEHATREVLAPAKASPSP